METAEFVACLFVLFSERDISLGKLYHLALVSMYVSIFCLKGYHFSNSVPHEQVHEDADFVWFLSSAY